MSRLIAWADADNVCHRPAGHLLMIIGGGPADHQHIHAHSEALVSLSDSLELKSNGLGMASYFPSITIRAVDEHFRVFAAKQRKPINKNIIVGQTE
jgi:hypothetical protein